MPTLLGQATFEALTESLRRFNEISLQLSNQAIDRDSAETRDLHQRWYEAFMEFEATTNRFHTIVQMYRDEIIKGAEKAG